MKKIPATEKKVAFRPHGNEGLFRMRSGLCLLLVSLLCAGVLPMAAQAASFAGNPMHGSHNRAAHQAAQSGYSQDQALSGPESAPVQTGQTGQTGQAGQADLAGQARRQEKLHDELRPGEAGKITWRLRIKEFAVTNGSVVTLGEIALPVGDMTEELWRDLSARQLWAAPEENGRPMNLTRPRLQQAMLQSMGRDFAALCLYPPSLMIQRGGRVLGPEDVQALTVKALTPLLAGLPGESSLSDFRLPAVVFIGGDTQRLELETPEKIAPGRLSLRYAVKEMDGSVIRRLTGTVFVDCWASVPVAAVPMNRDEALTPEKVTFMRKNLAHARERVWDGKGGPWRLTRAILPEQPILLSDLTHVPTVSKGASITLVYQGRTVRLSVKAQALADGVRGESIPVLNLGSKRQVYAVIWDAGTAVIDSGFSSPDLVSEIDRKSAF